MAIAATCPGYERRVRLLTMNIWARQGDWPSRRSYLTDEIHSLAPDLLTLQETIRTDSYDQVAELLADGYAIINSRIRAPDGMGISIASRFAIRELAEVDLQINERTEDFPCTALLTMIDSPLGQLVLINYFPSWKLDLEAEREQQALRLLRAIDDLDLGPDLPVIIAGDLDADPDAASIRFLTGRQSLGGRSVCYRDAWESLHRGEPGDTYTRENGLMVEDWPFNRIDYLLVRCGTHGGPLLQISDCRRVFDTDRDGVWASDHFGVLADLSANTTMPPGDAEALPAR